MRKERITITLPEQMLQKIDSLVDGQKIRSRSHAIEFFLRKSLGGPAKNAVILAGSKKIRLHPLQRRIPRALVPVNQKPVVERLITWLKDDGFSQIFLVVGYKKEKIKERIGDGAKLGVKLTYVEERGSECDALLSLRDQLEGSFFVVVDGSVLARLDLRKMIAFHENNRAVVTVALKNMLDLRGFRVAEMEGSKVLQLIEKPGKQPPTNLVDAGIYIMSPSIFEFMKSSCSFRGELLPSLAEKGMLFGYPFPGEWVEITGGGAIKKAEEVWKD